MLLAALLSKDLDGARLRGRTLAALGAVGGLLLTFGLGAYTSGTAYPVDAPLLSFLDLRNPVVDLRVPTTVFLLSGGVAAAYYLARRGWDRGRCRRRSNSRWYTQRAGCPPAHGCPP